MSPYEKAAALGESIIANHPFVDGNKRTCLAAMYALLLENNIRLIANPDELYSFIISISTGSITLQEIALWLTKNTTTR